MFISCISSRHVAVVNCWIPDVFKRAGCGGWRNPQADAEASCLLAATQNFWSFPEERGFWIPKPNHIEQHKIISKNSRLAAPYHWLEIEHGGTLFLDKWSIYLKARQPGFCCYHWERPALIPCTARQYQFPIFLILPSTWHERVQCLAHNKIYF